MNFYLAFPLTSLPYPGDMVSIIQLYSSVKLMDLRHIYLLSVKYRILIIFKYSDIHEQEVALTIPSIKYIGNSVTPDGQCVVSVWSRVVESYNTIGK